VAGALLVAQVAVRLMVPVGQSCSITEVSGEPRPRAMTACDHELEVLTKLWPQRAVRGQAHPALEACVDGLVYSAHG